MRRLTRRQRAAGALLCVVALAFIALDATGSRLAEAHSGTRGLLGSLYRGTDFVLGPARRFVQGIPDVGRNRTTIAKLQHENDVLRQRLSRQSADAKTAAQLAALRRRAGSHRVLPASVIALGPSGGFDWTVTLDAGSGDGVRVGQSVIDGDGLVGRILRVNGSSAVVLLAADPGSGVGARDTSTGELGIATGRGTGGYTFRPLDPTANLGVGDDLITGPSGRSSFVAGLPIGTITSVRRSTDGSTTASVRPASSATALNVVGVLIRAQPSPAPSNLAGPSGTGQ